MLTPWRPFNPAPDDPRVIHTVGRLEDLTALAEHGTRRRERQRVDAGADDLDAAARVRRARPARGRPSCRRARRRPVEGVALHLPLAPRSQGTSHLSEVERLMTDIVAAGVDRLDHPGRRTVCVSHLSEIELDPARAEVPRVRLPPPRRHRPVARRPRRPHRARDRARHPPRRARRHLRLPRPHGSARWHDPGRLRRHRPRHRARGADGRPDAARPGRPRSREGDWTRPGSCARRTPSAASSACSPSPRTCRPRCCSSRPAPRCPRSATRSRSGCGSPRPTSTAVEIG